MIALTNNIYSFKLNGFIEFVGTQLRSGKSISKQISFAGVNENPGPHYMLHYNLI